MFHMPGFDAFVVMLHDQGHIATKLLAQNAAAALTIGTPILFASVAHGTGHDIAGKGIANPAAMIEAVLLMSKAKRQHEPLRPSESRVPKASAAKTRAARVSMRLDRRRAPQVRVSPTPAFETHRASRCSLRMRPRASTA